MSVLAAHPLPSLNEWECLCRSLLPSPIKCDGLRRPPFRFPNKREEPSLL